MVDPSLKGKVRERLQSTIELAQQSVSKAAEDISFSAGKLAEIVRKRNGHGGNGVQPKSSDL